MQSSSVLPASLAIRIAFLMFIPLVRGDLPVHCVNHQIAGDWDFYLGPPSPRRSSCGHQSPDNEELQPRVLLTETAQRKHVVLKSPNTAHTETDDSGTWTMIYDEGFEVNVDGLSLFAFSRFDITVNGEQKTNVSKCGETQVGWYHNQDRTEFGCYYGRKHASEEQHVGLLSYVPSLAAKSADYDAPLGGDYHNSFAANLNLQQQSWTAKAHDWLMGKSLRQMNGMAGIFRSGTQETHKTDNRPTVTLLQKTSTKHQRSFLQSSTSLHQLEMDEALPASMDWRNVGGVSYLDTVMDQGDCGSCYAVATTHMLSARHRIKKKDHTIEPWSISFPLHCSEFNQGCNGGYAFLVARWSQDVGLVPNSCAAYDGSAGKCSLSCNSSMLQARYRADNHHYVGGYYGGATEREMMRELYHSGPVVASFEPKSDLMYYSGGVYTSVPNQRTEWEKVDHAVLLVGYGVEPSGEKYWLLQNSWGPEWGEGGFFRMARGTDESGIESIVVAADVVEDTRPTVLSQFAEEKML